MVPPVKSSVVCGEASFPEVSFDVFAAPASGPTVSSFFWEVEVLDVFFAAAGFRRVAGFLAAVFAEPACVFFDDARGLDGFLAGGWSADPALAVSSLIIFLLEKRFILLLFGEAG